MKLMDRSTGGASARPPRAAGRATHPTSKENYPYIEEKCYNLLANYFCALTFTRAPKSRKPSGSAIGRKLCLFLLFVCVDSSMAHVS